MGLTCVAQVSPWDMRKEANEKKLAFALANSDHLALLQAYKVSVVTCFHCSTFPVHQMMSVVCLHRLQGWCCTAKNGSKAGFQYCKENFLSLRGLQVRCLQTSRL